MANAGAHNSAQKTPHKKPPAGRVEATASEGLVVVGVGAQAGQVVAIQRDLGQFVEDNDTIVQLQGECRPAVVLAVNSRVSVWIQTFFFTD